MSARLPPHKQALGEYGESLATSYLLKQQFRIVSKNFRARYGEIDIIAQEGKTLVFVEVKTRYSTQFGLPEEAVTKRKLGEVIQTAQYYLTTQANLHSAWRIDVIAIILDPDTNDILYFNHIKSVTS